MAYHESKNSSASVIASPATDIVLVSDKTYKRKRGLFRLFEMPEQIVTFRVAALNTDAIRTLLTVEYANTVSFGQVTERRDQTRGDLRPKPEPEPVSNRASENQRIDHIENATKTRDGGEASLRSQSRLIIDSIKSPSWATAPTISP